MESNTITYKYYKFPDKIFMPTMWPENVDVSEIGLIQKKEDLEKGIIDNSWYVNVSYSGNIDLSHLRFYEINVKTPRRIWFGQ